MGDADQHVYDFVEGVREDRLSHLRATCPGIEVIDLQENHRSPGSSIVRYARCTLAGTRLGSPCGAVLVKTYPSSKRLGAVLKGAILAAERSCRTMSSSHPSVAVLAYRNRFVGRLSSGLRLTGGIVSLSLHRRVVVTLDEVEPAWQSLAWVLQAIGEREPVHVSNALVCAATLARVRGGTSASDEAERLERWARI